MLELTKEQEVSMCIGALPCRVAKAEVFSITNAGDGDYAITFRVEYKRVYGEGIEIHKPRFLLPFNTIFRHGSLSLSLLDDHRPHGRNAYWRISFKIKDEISGKEICKTKCELD